ncbi:SUMF1/EgtB/PvdO family nonheme iron enzyme [Haliscomenobacter hydrossis]|uniref:SUMF1/EgtB/PvdO family nonheme iron enzyme n=1 Tax=Haliscomenobacter hydrossis TaxID=2350 RepID=UPI001FE1E023|nr:SUMF1/EgtB/PvdO family nonheme iron enzyme [Haliscomenobacter hydrossis]
MAQTDPITSLAETLKTNVVAISASIDGVEERGFGFITAEQNGQLYIATAAHVVKGYFQDKVADRIRVKFFNDSNWIEAKCIHYWKNEDLALLESPRPIALQWQPNCIDLNTGTSRKVRFIGINGGEPRWVDPGLDGNIFSDDEFKLEFSINTIRPGTSGAPLLTERGIVGMITQDEGAISVALKLTQIKYLFSTLEQPYYFALKSSNSDLSPSVPVQEYPFQMIMIEGGTFMMGCNQKKRSECFGDEVQAFIQKLNTKTGKKYRLPTEAEWEYAARGGNKSKGYKYSGSNTLDEVAWYFSNSGGAPRPVGLKKPNELGLYDMSGNVWEWCQDLYTGYPDTPQINPLGGASGFDHVHRGGSWVSDSQFCRVSHRYYDTPDRHYGNLGFRLAL